MESNLFRIRDHLREYKGKKCFGCFGKREYGKTVYVSGFSFRILAPQLFFVLIKWVIVNIYTSHVLKNNKIRHIGKNFQANFDYYKFWC